MFTLAPTVHTYRQSAVIALLLLDPSRNPITGLTYEDVSLKLLKQDAQALEAVALSEETFVETSHGFYMVRLSADDLGTLGSLLVFLTQSPTYTGAFNPHARLLYVNHYLMRGGLLQNRGAWLPLVLTNGGVPVGLYDLNAFTVARYLGPGAGSFTSLTLSAANFREILHLGVPTGIYQLYLDRTSLALLGELVLELQGPSLDDVSSNFAISEAAKRRLFVEVVDREAGDAVVEGATVYLSSVTLNEVVDQAVTDALGQVKLEAPEGDYRLTLSKGTAIFQENNLAIRVVNPNNEDMAATPAHVVSGNPGPYAFDPGDDLHIRVSGGELQKIILNSEDFIPPNVLVAADPDALAEVLNMKGHSFTAGLGGLNGLNLSLLTELTGAQATIRVEGGTANAKLNFPTELKQGVDAGATINSWQLNGAQFTPAFPLPPSDTVELTYRVVDLSGKPVEGAEVNIVNKFSPTVRASDGVSSVLGRKVLQFFTDPNGILQDGERGKPRLIKGAVVDFLIKGTGLVRSEITVPQTDFTLMDEVEAAEDLFTIQVPNLPSAPRS